MSDWGGGFSAGVATGAAMGRNQAEGSTEYVRVEVSDLKAERELVEEYAARKALMAVRAATCDALREVAPQHPLAALPATGAKTTLGPAARVIFEEAFDRIVATGLDDDPELRRMCPGLTKNRDKARQDKVKATMSNLWKTFEQELSVARRNRGIFSRVFKTHPEGFPIFKDWFRDRTEFVEIGQTLMKHGMIDHNREIIHEALVFAFLNEASQKWGSFEISGSDKFKEVCIKVAAENNYIIGNKELQEKLNKLKKKYA